MKGVDAALWAVCDALGLEIQALPVYSPDLDDDDYSGDDGSARDPLDLFSRRANSRAHLNQCPDDIEWIGSGFDSMKANWFGNYEDSLGRRMDEANFASKYTGIYWLNGPGHFEPSMADIHVQTPSEITTYH